jgi:molybdopterin/thiamine biosynthesis adenylyltransferase
MLQQQISLSSDLKGLRDQGYQIEICDGHLFAHHIPYVNGKCEVKYGSLVSVLDLSGTKTVKPRTHVIMFCGEEPCDKQGRVIQGIKHSGVNKSFSNGETAAFSFSNKPANGYSDYFHKVSTYASIISAPAKSIQEGVTERPYKPVVEQEEDSVFKYFDTNSSRANIESVSQKLRSQNIAIVGLGGTGAYVLDFIAKTCVEEIHIYDGDVFLNHNAFRSPSAASLEQIQEQPLKTEYYGQMYSEMRDNIFEHPYYLESDKFQELDNFDFVFICVDNNDIRNELIKYLREKKVIAIDVGLGVTLVDNSIIGTVRVTTFTERKNDHLNKRIPILNDADNEYQTNIQIAELNAFNAILAVIKWKKLSEFYQDLENEHHTTYSINVAQLLNEDAA